MRVVYVDTLFFLNLAVDYFLLVLTAKVAGVYIKRSRLLASALVGALLAVLLYFPPLPKTLALLLRLAVCCVTALAAFIGEPEKLAPAPWHFCHGDAAVGRHRVGPVRVGRRSSYAKRRLIF